MSETPRPTWSLDSIVARLRRLLGMRDSNRTPHDQGTDTRERLTGQVDLVRKAFGKDGVGAAGPDGPLPPGREAEALYFYRPGHVLVRDGDDFELLRSFVGARTEEFLGEVERAGDPARGVVLARIPARADHADAVLATLDELDREHPDRAERGEPVATPDHLLYVTMRGRLCPATEPEAVPGRAARPFPPPAQRQGRTRKPVRVSVVDTGLWEPAVSSPTTPWMAGVVADPTDVEAVNAAAIHPYAGHGTFVAGVVRCVAPDTRVEVEGVLTQGGAVYESAICQQLHEALEDDNHPQVISISAGTYSRKNVALLSFEMLAAVHGLGDGEATLVVAAAGNDSTKDKFWPAAFPWVVGVGSVDADGRISHFSNYGDWVDVYARGSKIVNAFPVGTYVCTEPPNKGAVRTFKGLAQWSGTSFSTPIVSGLIAARMSAANENVLQARDAVLGSGTTGGNDPDGNPITIVGPLT